MTSKKTVVLGASSNPEKYSYKAVQMLVEYGHEPIPIHPSGKAVGAVPTRRSIGELQDSIDTVTLYLGPQNVEPLIDQILTLKPRRIIMNPGAESAELKLRAEKQGIEVVEGCTLVMLRTGQF